MTLKKLANIYLETADKEKLYKLEKHGLIKVEWGAWVVPQDKSLSITDDIFNHFFQSSLPKPKDVKVDIKENASDHELKTIIETISDMWYHCWDTKNPEKVHYYGFGENEPELYIEKRVELDI